MRAKVRLRSLQHLCQDRLHDPFACIVSRPALDISWRLLVADTCTVFRFCHVWRARVDAECKSAPMGCVRC